MFHLEEVVTSLFWDSLRRYYCICNNSFLFQFFFYFDNFDYYFLLFVKIVDAHTSILTWPKVEKQKNCVLSFVCSSTDKSKNEERRMAESKRGTLHISLVTGTLLS